MTSPLFDVLLRAKSAKIVPDEATKQQLLDQLKATFGEGKFIGDIKVDPSLCML